ncbi:MAG: NAD(+) synthase [Clostridia bacterium]|nr:NAD(+) synthase [Clostridia bacterium]
MSENKIRVGVITPEIRLANPEWNANELIQQIKNASEKGMSIVCTPELSITGATCGDLFFQEILLEKSLVALKNVIDSTKNLNITCIIGTYIPFEEELYHVAVVIKEGNILGIIPKIKLSYHEKRYFKCGKHLIGKKVELFGAEILVGNSSFPIGISSSHTFGVIFSEDIKNSKTDVIFDLSGNYELVGNTEKITRQIKSLTRANENAYVYCTPGINESTSDFVYSGFSAIFENGNVLVESSKYCFESTLTYADLTLSEKRNISERLEIEGKMDFTSLEEKKKMKEEMRYPFVPEEKEALKKRCEEVLKMQAAALLRRLKQVGSFKTVIGLSGGSDSTLAFLVILEAYKMAGIDNANMIAITMPGFGTTNRTYENACNLAKKYHVTLREISIKDACVQHYKDIGLDVNDRSIAYENAQARERTQILMDIANQEDALVVGTGDMSELALGWCTYNGDHMSMYAVNAGIPKTLIKHIIAYKAEEEGNLTLHDIIDTPISPELLPPDEEGNIAQKTESSIGPYILHDYFLYHFLRYQTSPRKILETATKTFVGDYTAKEIRKWLQVFMHRFFTQQFKRNCVPDGPKIGRIGLSPRGDLCIPSDADKHIWHAEIENEKN